jgi:hydroxypyruvate isomerase
VPDPYADVALCAPYAINVHCKVSTHPSGSKQPEPADYARQFKILRDVHYQGYIALEYEAEPDPYEAIPGFLKNVKPHLDA